MSNVKGREGKEIVQRIAMTELWVAIRSCVFAIDFDGPDRFSTVSGTGQRIVTGVRTLSMDEMMQ